MSYFDYCDEFDSYEEELEAILDWATPGSDLYNETYERLEMLQEDF